MNNVANIRESFYELYRNNEFVTDKSDVKTIELVGASFIADENTIFGNMNTDYAKREIDWYSSGSLFVDDIPGKTPEIWKQVSSKNGEINSNYGWCVFSSENWDQFGSVLETLKSHRDSRRAIMIYTRPKMQVDYCRDGMSDFICTNTVQYLIRDHVLNVIVQMRSNDAVFGYKNDLYWQQHVASLLCKELNCLGYKIHWQVGSLHLYERHFPLMKEYFEYE